MVVNLEIASSSAARRWQVSLRGVLFVTFLVALALCDFRLHGGSLSDILPVVLTAISAAIVFGLCAEMRDLRRQLGGQQLTSDERWGLRFAVAWRIGAALLLIVYHVVDHFDAKLFFGPNAAGDSPGWPIRVVYFLALIVILSGTRQLARRARAAPSAALWWRAVIWTACATLISVFLYFMLAIHFLVHVAICGVEISCSTAKVPFLEGVSPLPITRGEPAFWLGIGAAILIPVNYWLIYLSVRDTSSAAARRVWSVLFLILFAAMASLFTWNYFVALPSAAPFLMEETPQGGVWHFAIIGAPCLLVLTTAIAYRISARPRTDEPESALTAAPTSYWHERRWVAGALAIIFAAPLAWQIAPKVGNHVTFYWYGGFSLSEYVMTFPWFEIAITVGTMLLGESDFALFAFLLVAVSAAFARFRQRQVLRPAAAPALPPARFLFAWLAVTATTMVGLPVLAIYGFALWMAPWYIGDWLLVIGL